MNLSAAYTALQDNGCPVAPTFRKAPYSAHSLQKEFRVTTHYRLTPPDGSLKALIALLIFAQTPLF